MTQIGSHYLPAGECAGMWFICSCYSRVTCKTVPTPGDHGIWGQCEWLNYNLGKVCRKDTPIWKPGRTNTSSQMQCFSFQLQRAPIASPTQLAFVLSVYEDIILQNCLSCTSFLLHYSVKLCSILTSLLPLYPRTQLTQSLPSSIFRCFRQVCNNQFCASVFLKKWLEDLRVYSNIELLFDKNLRA